MTGLIVAAAIIGLICVVGAVVLFLLLPFLLAGLAFLALLTTMIVVAVVLVPNFVTLDSFKPQIAEAVQQAIGREISIGGPIGFSVWPVLGLQLKDISLGNPAGARDPIMLSAKELGVGVTLSSLLDRKLELRELRLVGPQINLSVDAQGRGNWVFASRAPSRRDDAANDQPKDSTGNVENKPMEIKDVEIRRVEVIDGDLSYDGANGSTLDLADIDLVFTMPGLDEKAEASGDLTFRGREVKLTGSLDQPRRAASKDGAALAMSLSFGPDDLQLSGTLQQQTFKGQIKGAIGDLSALVGWATDNPAAALPFKVVALQSGLEVSLTRGSFSNLSLALDDTTISGTAAAQWDGAKPHLKADIDVGTLTLDRFLSPAGAKPEGEKSPEGAGPDLSGLSAFNADLTARLAGVTFHNTEIGATTLRVDLQNGKMQSSLSPASLYGGTVRGKLDLLPSARRSPPSFAAAVTLDGVNVDQLLTKLNGSSRLSGTADFTTTLTGPVLGGEALMAALDGEGRFMFRDGAVKGVNIAAILRRAKSLLGRPSGTVEEGPAQTDFTELSGSFRITDGVARNDDLKMLSPLLRVTGKGSANLASQIADYRIEAALVADLTGQGGVMQRRGLVVPVNVRGPFSNLSYEPDLAGLALGNVDAARQAGEAIRNLNPREVREGAKGALQNLLGGGQSSQPAPAPAPTSAPAPTPEAKPADNPLDSLQNIFGR